MAWKVQVIAALPQRVKPHKTITHPPSRLGVAAIAVVGAGLLWASQQPDTRSPVASVPKSVDFGNHQVQSQSAANTVVVRNQGSADLNVRFVGIAVEDQGDFRLIGSTCEGAPTPPGGTCRIQTVFQPQTQAGRIAKLIIADNATDSVQSVTLLGNGVVPAPKKPKPVGSTWKEVVLHNDGEAAVTLTQLYLPHDNDNFTLDPQQCMHKLVAGGESCQVRVQYTPSYTDTSCTPQLLLRDNTNNAIEGKNGELVVKICEAPDEANSQTGQTPPCEYKGIAFTGICMKKRP